MVINLHNYKDKDYIYIGRGSDFGNPYVIGVDGNRAEVILKFKTYFIDKINRNKTFRDKVLSLKGRKLGCFCFPLPCHGNVIEDYISSQISIDENSQDNI